MNRLSVPLAGIIDVVRPYAEYVLPLMFVGFFVAAGVAIAFGDRRYVRQTYVASFLLGLLLVNVVFTIYPLPFVAWHKFTEPRDVEQTTYEIRVVDADGDEIRFDDRATWQADGVSMDVVRTKMREEFSPAERDEVAQYLLERTRLHREYLQSPSPVRVLRFPPHGFGNTWTARKLATYDRFVGVRMYRVEFETSPDGTEVTSYSEELVYEYVDDETTASASASATNQSSASAAGLPTVASGGVPA